ncbi:YggS family pyridoxal phosphate-dependent enzyme [Gordonia aichiensis]|uniref:Pyridoxal phosphate homeostasis protein n=1 Tax=Gordonia aichiensis NBRC 108223 TaxID=1220583 RepID=L7KP24_9ACTN|nr:YggS family pyridoxal phosphate-dependent enzyme [Gordonia aichiensis]GAC49702.1 hypothetical protein GOACH_16_00840 [Gordonia aichiensis NBRC 108223]
MTTAEDDERTAQLAESLSRVRSRLDTAVDAAGRRRGDVELLVVTKFFPASDVQRLITLGEKEFGESREPEASRKIDELRDAPTGGLEGISFDMIGSVQTKKARTVARWARAVHSVDRAKLIDHLSTAGVSALDAGERSTPLEVYLQLSLDGDPTRGGALEDDLPELAERVEQSDSLALRGLMVIAPLDGEIDDWMERTAQVHERFRGRFPQATGLSAGMSSDLESAVAHGSTCVRVGTAIMGPRPLVSH